MHTGRKCGPKLAAGSEEVEARKEARMAIATVTIGAARVAIVALVAVVVILQVSSCGTGGSSGNSNNITNK